jgi:hypothetical protein
VQEVLFKVFRWLISGAQIKFVGFTFLFSIVSFLISKLTDYLTPYVGVNGLNSAFLGLTPNTWYFVNIFNLAYGVPLIIGAFVIRFLIRRIPIIG